MEYITLEAVKSDERFREICLQNNFDPDDARYQLLFVAGFNKALREALADIKNITKEIGK